MRQASCRQHLAVRTAVPEAVCLLCRSRTQSVAARVKRSRVHRPAHATRAGKVFKAARPAQAAGTRRARRQAAPQLLRLDPAFELAFQRRLRLADRVRGVPSHGHLPAVLGQSLLWGLLTCECTRSAAMGATTGADRHQAEDTWAPVHHRFRPSAQLLRCVPHTLAALACWSACHGSFLWRQRAEGADVRIAGICYMQVPTDTMDTLDCCKARFCRCAAVKVLTLQIRFEMHVKLLRRRLCFFDLLG